MKTITVFTPTYNRAYILKQCYLSLMNQTNKNFVWLIVDDGSTDNTKQLVNSFKRDNKIEIEYIYQKNGGKYKAVNTAVKNCKTELFAFLDSDDYYTTETIDVFINTWNKIKNNDKVAGIVARRSYKTGKLVGSQKDFPDGIINFSKLLFKKKFYGDTCRLYRKDILIKYLYPELEEKFIPENVMLGRIDEYYDIYFLNKGLSISEYLSDGYTNSYKKLLYTYPYSYSLSLKQNIINAPSIILKCKYMTSYIEWGLIYKLKDCYHSVENKILYTFMFPIALFLKIIGLPRWYSPKRGLINKLLLYFNIIKSFILSFNGSKATILDSKETVNLCLEKNLSLIRFGDGEFNILNGDDVHYQKYTKKLCEEMNELIKYYEQNGTDSKYLLCMPKFFFQCKGYKLFKNKSWISSWSLSRYKFLKQFNQNIVYGDAFTFAKGNENIYSKLWKGHYNYCIFVHNNEKYSKLFEKNYKIKTHFLKIDSCNAYNMIDSVEKEICEIVSKQKDKKVIVIVSMGPAAKALVYRLRNVVTVLDTGHCFDYPLNKGDSYE